MAARVTFERILRDEDDATGQSIRDWKIESGRGDITIHVGRGYGFILLRPEDVDLLMVDLGRAKEAALRLSQETAG